LILDVVVEAGNPADAERFLPLLERHIARQGTPVMAATPASTISSRQRPWVSKMSPSTRSAPLRSTPWSRAAGCTAS
jgi:hypothetical protein